MSLSWLSRLLRPQSPSSPSAGRRCRPSLEILEDRHLLALVPVNPLLFGLNQPWTDGRSWLDFDSNPNTTTRGEATRDGVDRLAVQSFRYVGGTVANLWDWEAGDWVSDAEMQAFGDAFYQGQNQRRMRFQATGLAGPNGFYAPLPFHQFSQEAGFETIWVPNLATGPGGDEAQITAHAADLFRHLSDNGVAVRFVEMGNEFSSPQYATRITSSEDYLRDHAHPVAVRVRELYPEARIAVAGVLDGVIWSNPSTYADAVSRLDERRGTWDSGLAAGRFHGGISNFDAVVYHNYNMNAGALPVNAGPDNDNWEQALLAFPEATLRNAAQNAHSVYGDDVELWVTEFGINHSLLTGTDPRIVWLNTTVTNNSAWDALFTAGFYLGGIQQNDTYKVMMRHALDQVMRLGGTSGARHAEISPTGQVLAHLFSLAEQSTFMDTLTLPDNPTLPVTVRGRNDLGVFQAVRFAGPETETWVILNRGNTDRQLSLPNEGGYTLAQQWVYQSDAEVVPGGFAPMPAGPAPWLGSTPMGVSYNETGLDPGGPVTFSSPKFSLTFVTRSYRPSSVQGVVVNDGMAQRSLVTSLTVTFAGPVAPSPGAFEVRQQGGGLVDVNVTTTLVGGQTIAFLTFSGPGIVGGSLADGRYLLTIRGAGEAGSDFVFGDDPTEAFFRRYGDVDGDGLVTGEVLIRPGQLPPIDYGGDLGALLDALGRRLGEVGYVDFLDANGDGAIDALDLAEYRLDVVRSIIQ